MSAAAQHADPALDLDAVRDALDRYRDAPGQLSVVSTLNWGGQVFDTSPEGIALAVDYVRDLDVQGAAGIYHRGTTIREGVKLAGRGRADDSAAWLWLQFDLDYGKDGYAPGPDVIRDLVEAADLPLPSEWIHSGHGMYPRWWLDEPAPDSPFMRALVTDFYMVIRDTFKAKGYAIDPTITDAARVWRVPGTVNRRDANDPVLCEVVELNGAVYRFRDLRDVVPASESSPDTPTSAGTVSPLTGLRHFTLDQAREYVERLALRPLREARPGGRNIQLNTSAVVLGHFVPDFLSPDAARAALRSAAARYVADEPREAEATITSGLTKGMSEPYRRVGDYETGTGGQELNTPATARPDSTWRPVDLVGEWDEEDEPEAPTLLQREDGACLIYPGRTHSIYGESESGKSWVALILCAQVLADGGRVLYIDHESDKGPIKARLRALGVTKAMVERLDYVRPDGPRDAAWLDLLERSYALAVIDGVSVAIASDGASSDSTDETARWLEQVPRALETRTGAAVVTIDHVTKSRDGRGRFAIGSQAKLNAISGAAYTARVHAPFGRGQVGELVLRITKDRPGGVRPHCGPAGEHGTQEAARVVLDSTDPKRIKVEVRAWSESGDETTDLPFGDALVSLTREDWTSPEQPPLPTDVLDYRGKGAAAAATLARFLRARADSAGVGVTMVEARHAVMQLKDDSGKPIFKRDTVDRAWGALVGLGRLSLVNEKSENQTGRSWWVPRADDPH